MIIGLINGSPKGIKANSLCILDDIKDNLTKNNNEANNQIKEFTWNTSSCKYEEFDTISKCDVIIFSFPLYIDSIPSHLLRILIDFEQYIDNLKKAKNSINAQNIHVYAIVNNGFFDGKQNHLAIDNIKHWCNSIGFKFIQGIGIGGGGMLPSIKNVPLGIGLKKTIGIELQSILNNLESNHHSNPVFVEPNIPAFAYKLLAQRQWRLNAKANGLKSSDLGRRLV